MRYVWLALLLTGCATWSQPQPTPPPGYTTLAACVPADVVVFWVVCTVDFVKQVDDPGPSRTPRSFEDAIRH